LQGGQANFHEVGRAMATLMTDEVFHEVAYKARNRSHLLAAVDEFLDAVTVLPPGEWDPSIRIEPPAAVPSQVLIIYSTVVTMRTMFLNIKETIFFLTLCILCVL
jgi:sodium bicarbonate transporter 10